VFDLRHLGGTDCREICSLWKEIPDETVCVLVETALPGMVRGRKEDFRTQSSGDVLMRSEFLAVVKSDRVDGVADGPEPTHGGLAGSGGGSPAQQRDFRELGLTFDQR